MFGNLTKRLASRQGYPSSNKRNRTMLTENTAVATPPAAETNGTPPPAASSPAPAKPKPGGAKPAPKGGKTNPKAATKNGKASAKPKPAAAPAERKPREKKEGLRNAQVRILKFLTSKAGAAGGDRNVIAENAPCDLANCVELIGSHDPEKRAANDAKHFKSLISYGYVKATPTEVDGRTKVIYTATATGRKVAEKL